MKSTSPTWSLWLSRPIGEGPRLLPSEAWRWSGAVNTPPRTEGFWRFMGFFWCLRFYFPISVGKYTYIHWVFGIGSMIALYLVGRFFNYGEFVGKFPGDSIWVWGYIGSLFSTQTNHKAWFFSIKLFKTLLDWWNIVLFPIDVSSISSQFEIHVHLMFTIYCLEKT